MGGLGYLESMGIDCSRPEPLKMAEMTELAPCEIEGRDKAVGISYRSSLVQFLSENTRADHNFVLGESTKN